MRTIKGKTIRSLCMLCALVTLNLDLPPLLSPSNLLLAQNRGQWNQSERFYDFGLQAGRQDARRNLSNDYRRHQRSFNPRWEADFRQGYEDGYERRSNRDRSYNRDYGYRNSPYGYDSNQYGYSSGSMIWTGEVDHYVELRIQGSRVQSRERQGSPTINEAASFTTPLPRADVQVFVRKRAGRGEVGIVQQPSRSNGYTAVIAINDERGGSDHYELEVAWR